MPLHQRSDELKERYRTLFVGSGFGAIAYIAIGVLIAVVLLVGSLPAFLGSPAGMLALLVAAGVGVLVWRLHK